MHLSVEEMGTVEKCVNDSMSWMNSKMNAQSKLSITQDATVKVADIIAKIQVSNLMFSLISICNYKFTRSLIFTDQELEDVCNPVINRPKPSVEETSEVNEQNSGAHVTNQGEEGKGETKGNQQTKEMQID